MKKIPRLTILVEKRVGGWAVVLLETGKVLDSRLPYKKRAIFRARDGASLIYRLYSLACELKVRNLDGTIKSVSSYGRDPRKVKG